MRTAAILIVLAVSSVAHAVVGRAGVNSKGEQVWELGNLKGTSAEIGETINREVVLFLKNIRTASQGAADAQSAIDNERRACLSRLAADVRYKALKTDISLTAPLLESARSEHRTSDAIQYSSKINRDRAALAQMEKDAVAGDVALREHENNLRIYKSDLADAQAKLAAAVAWRDKLVEASRNSLRFHWPLEVGDIALVGDVVPMTIDRDGFTALTDVWEKGKETDEKEKIVNVEITHHAIVVALMCDRGFKASKGIEEKKMATIDAAFVVKAMKETYAGLVVVMQRKDDDLDRLMAGLIAKPEETVPAATTQPH